MKMEVYHGDPGPWFLPKEVLLDLLSVNSLYYRLPHPTGYLLTIVNVGITVVCCLCTARVPAHLALGWHVAHRSCIQTR